MTNELTALANGREMGTVIYRNARLSFIYAESWRQEHSAYPLSLSMPLASAEHGHTRIERFLWGLLPDNDRVLENWGKRFQVSPRNAFQLIANVGEDCAGAVQFVRPDQLESLRAEPAAREIDWLTEDDVAERLRSLRADHSAWRSATDTGQFSLAGAQPKTALLFRTYRWGVPSGRTPTTHILKPPTGEWDGHAENEHFCLLLARASGLVVPNSSVSRFRDEIAIVIERYDRLFNSGNEFACIRRICVRPLPSIPPANTRATAGRAFARLSICCGSIPVIPKTTYKVFWTLSLSIGSSPEPTVTRRTTPCFSAHRVQFDWPRSMIWQVFFRTRGSTSTKPSSR